MELMNLSIFPFRRRPSSRTRHLPGAEIAPAQGEDPLAFAAVACMLAHERAGRVARPKTRSLGTAGFFEGDSPRVILRPPLTRTEEPAALQVDPQHRERLLRQRAEQNVRRLIEHNRREKGLEGTAELRPHPVRSVGIVGAGLMGTAIAAVHLQHELPVVITDSDSNALSTAAERIFAACSRFPRVSCSVLRICSFSSSCRLRPASDVSGTIAVDRFSDAFSRISSGISSVSSVCDAARTTIDSTQFLNSRTFPGQS